MHRFQSLCVFWSRNLICFFHSHTCKSTVYRPVYPVGCWVPNKRAVQIAARSNLSGPALPSFHSRSPGQYPSGECGYPVQWCRRSQRHSSRWYSRFFVPQSEQLPSISRCESLFQSSAASVFLQLKANRHTALPAHRTGEQSQIPISTFHSLYICGVQRLPFHHFVGEYISVHIREGGNITLT